MLRYALLGFLRYSPMTGYELKQAMDGSTAYFWHAKQSQIYATLKQLTGEGLIESTIEPQEGRPDRRVYTLTETGHVVLDNWLNTPITELDPRKEPLLLKLFFSGSADRAGLLTQLRLQRELHRSQLATYATETKAVIREAAQKAGMEDERLMWEVTRRFGELFEEMYIAWLDETIAEIEGDI